MKPSSEAVPVLSGDATDEETDARGFTVEASIGFAVLSEGHTYSSSSQKPGVGLAAGVGYFVAPRAALGLRVTDYYRPGGTVGVVGPHAQLWLTPKVWFGSSIGVGFLTGGGVSRLGGFPSFDVRFGGAVLGGLNISLEIARIGVLGPFSDGYEFGAPSYLLDVMVGYQLM